MDFRPVALDRCKNYDTEAITAILERQFLALGITAELIRGKKVVIKPNLVMNKPPEFAATTHPSVIDAAARIIKRLGAESITVAESSGGPYNEITMKSHYKGCGIADVAKKEGLILNTDPSSGTMTFDSGVKCRSFNIITPILEADVILNICKLKTHSLTKLSCGIKNLFGVIPGVEKFEMHARFPRQEDFVQMICDLCQLICQKKEMITVCDGIVGMEGNGPTGGTPKEYGVLLSSRSPFCLDLVAEAVLGFEGTVPMLCVARERSLCPESVSGLSVIGDKIEDCKITGIILPDTQKFNILRALPNILGGKAAKFFEPKPAINKKTCIGCGVCARSCPQHTITVKNKKAYINYKKCIRCYCCQELCPINSVEIKQNLLIKIIH
ncbi:MAG: DUF362 domain-containing protein [Clostridia bacterium]|nr:DUF362 domain-containing protein [Clostridia bacterium]